MADECKCGCCGPTAPDTEGAPGADRGQGDAYPGRKVAELERRIERLEQAVA